MELLLFIGIFIAAVLILYGFADGGSDSATNFNAVSKERRRVASQPKAATAQATQPKAHQPKATHAPPPPIPSSRELRGRAYVIDGDTIIVSKTKVRLAGIDAPELDRPWGQKSKWELIRICKGHSVRVELTGETSYDRLIGTCYLPDGTDIGAEIIKAGLALDGGYYSKGKYKHFEPEGVRRKLKPFGNQIRQ
ncbi:thermonuclease family protein [uncultured Sulfitobacter sp.]|uniref:thermonuclease family protein n=1 Tax=uncultured Sulfitobacter sp. TaxID=191468 RepID=UPI0026199934|nr:thermonuclease family protein [uncultured Sulfitobacter sp.]